MSTPAYVVVGQAYDMGRRFDMRRYHGPIVVSSEAIVLVDFRMNYKGMGVAVGAPFGIVGAMIGAAIGAGLDQVGAPRKEFATTLLQLPPEIRLHPDWPLAKVDGDYPTVVIPRTAITAVAYSIWTVFEIDTDSQTFHLHLSLLRRFRMMRIMREFGYW
jgi:hypothetical protein